MVNKLRTEFEKLYGKGQSNIYFAPGRVNLIGEHTDYNGGHVFPCALTLGTYAVVRKNSLKRLRFFSHNVKNPQVIEAKLDKPEKKNGYRWANYPLGVIWAFWENGMQINQGLDVMVWGNIPSGSGLSSSASLGVLVGTMLKHEFKFPVNATEIALLAQKAENEFNGCNCGIMDQFASANGKSGHAMFLDTATLKFEYAPIKLKGAKIVITNSWVKHSLVDSEYNTRRNESTRALKDLQKHIDIATLGDLKPDDFEKYKHLIHDETCMKRARHAVYENHRTIEAVAALKANQLERFGQLMKEAHISMRDDYEASCEEVDYLAELAWKIDGVIGCRITGGGFGGCTVAIVKDDAISRYKEVISSKYKDKYKKEPSFYIVEIGDGARKI